MHRLRHEETTMILPLLLAAAPIQAAAPATPARLSPEAADARCVVVLGFINAQGKLTPDRVEAVKNGTIYYLGKLRGRNPGINLTATLDAAAKLATAQKVNVGPEAQRCGAELSQLAGAARPAGAPPAAATPRKP
jgi:hypothetical protein